MEQPKIVNVIWFDGKVNSYGKATSPILAGEVVLGNIENFKLVLEENQEKTMLNTGDSESIGDNKNIKNNGLYVFFTFNDQNNPLQLTLEIYTIEEFNEQLKELQEIEAYKNNRLYQNTKNLYKILSITSGYKYYDSKIWEKLKENLYNLSVLTTPNNTKKQLKNEKLNNEELLEYEIFSKNIFTLITTLLTDKRLANTFNFGFENKTADNNHLIDKIKNVPLTAQWTADNQRNNNQRNISTEISIINEDINISDEEMTDTTETEATDITDTTETDTTDIITIINHETENNTNISEYNVEIIEEVLRNWRNKKKWNPLFKLNRLIGNEIQVEASGYELRSMETIKKKNVPFVLKEGSIINPNWDTETKAFKTMKNLQNLKKMLDEFVKDGSVKIIEKEVDGKIVKIGVLTKNIEFDSVNQAGVFSFANTLNALTGFYTDYFGKKMDLKTWREILKNI